MSIGAIIGAGLFSSLPMGIDMVGPKVGRALVAGAIFICMKTIPSLYMQSAIPISAGGYVYMSRFIHPSVAFVQSLNSCVGMLNIAVMSMTFASYFCQLFPNAAKRSFLRVPAWLQIALCLFSMGISFYMGLTLLQSLNPSLAISMIAFYIVGYGYYFIRVAYMKKQGVDIIARGKVEPASRVEKNKPLTAEEEAKLIKNK